jgi:hypothetical protein
MAFYFGWMQHYLIWLFFPGIIGLIFFIIIEVVADNDEDESISVSEMCILLYTLMLGVGTTLFD